MYRKAQTQTTLSRIGSTFVSTPPQFAIPPHALTFTVAEGAGYFPARRGQLIGPNQRYKILRMLGVGQRSSVFLVKNVIE